MTTIAPTAMIDSRAELGSGVRVGPGCVIQADVVIGDDCELRAGVIIERGVRMGQGNRVYSYAVLGGDPQITGEHDPDTQLIIGDGNTFREYVTVNRGSPSGGGRTIIGNRNSLMTAAHVGHDVAMEDDIVMVNQCLIAGHCKIESRVQMSGYSSVHQFCTIGRCSFLSGMTGSARDIPPYVRASGVHPCILRGLNTIGLQRAGIASESIRALKKAYQRIYGNRSGDSLETALQAVSHDFPEDEHVQYLVQSLRNSMKHRFGRYLECFRDSGHGSARPEHD